MEGDKLFWQNKSTACSKRNTRTSTDTREGRGVNKILQERKNPFDKLRWGTWAQKRCQPTWCASRRGWTSSPWTLASAGTTTDVHSAPHSRGCKSMRGRRNRSSHSLGAETCKDTGVQIYLSLLSSLHMRMAGLQLKKASEIMCTAVCITQNMT